MRILVVEDERKVANFIKKGLEEEHYAVDVAYDGERGLELIEINEYDLLVLDLMIPKIDGLEVLKKVRRNKNNVSILVLTAKDTVEDIEHYILNMKKCNPPTLTPLFNFVRLFEIF